MRSVHILVAAGVVYAGLGCENPQRALRAPAPQGESAKLASGSDQSRFVSWRRLDDQADVRSLLGEHVTMGLRTQFERGQVLLRVGTMREKEPALRLHAVSWGCAKHLQPLDRVEPKRPERDSDLVSYAQPDGAFEEWYRHAPAGLEQGFTVSSLPACARADGKLKIALSTSPGWVSAVTHDQRRATFRDAAGHLVEYSEPHAHDAQGVPRAIVILRDGESVALEVDVRDTVLPLVIDPLVWVEQQKVVSNESEAYDTFGQSVAISGGMLAVGAPGENAKGAGAGSVYAYTRSGISWAGQQKISASDGAADDAFGISVASTALYLAVGANGDSDGGASSGSVYVFTRAGANWGTQKKVVASDAQAGDRFGSAVAIDATTLLVGARADADQAAGAGSAYVYTFNGTNWVFQQKLLPTDTTGGYASDAFGYSVALSGDTAVIGAPFDQEAGADRGAAYVFTRSGSTWTQRAKLIASDALDFDLAGKSVSISGGTLAIGSRDNSDKGAQAGAVWVYTGSAATWTKQAKLYGNDEAASDQFGYSVAVQGDTLAVGAAGDDSYAGSVYVFTRAAATWTQQTKLFPSDPIANGGYGTSVALDQTNVAVGAPGANADKGAAYVAALNNGSACTVAGDCKSGLCVEGVCCNTACNGVCLSCLASRKTTGADGVCGNIKNNTDPDAECSDQAASTCGTTGMCNGSGACTLFASGTECAAASCVGTTSVNRNDTCNGSGVCQVTATQPCSSGYKCEAGACHTDCTAGTEAQSCDTTKGFKCIAGECKIPQGDTCAGAGADCETGHCVDGVCCDTACDHECTACTNPLKGSGDDGVCEPVSANTNPRSECTAGAGDCAADGLCDGEGNCRSFAPPTKACGQGTSCDDGVIKGELCDGAGQCGASEANCAPFLCAGTECAGSCVADGDCTVAGALPDYVGAFCNGAKKCEEKHADGASCATTHECASGYCVDGYCCNAACEGQCEACAEDGAEGTCVAVQDQPRGGRPACDVAPAGEPCQEVSCDGETRDSCAGYVGSKVVCAEASCAEGLATGTRRCDGTGKCADDAPKACEPYACGASECLLSCQTNADCVSGNTCIENECRTGSRCNDDNTGVIDSMSVETSCGRFLCRADECLTTCMSSTECAVGYLCDSNGSCEAVKQANNVEDAGCGCRAAGGTAGQARWALLGMALLLGRRRSRVRQATSASRPGKIG